MHAPTVLILTHSPDAHVPPVQAELIRRGRRVCVIDQADFPEQLALSSELDVGTGWRGTFRFQREDIAFHEILSVWRRRPQSWQAPSTYSLAVRTFAEREAARAFAGIMDCLEYQSPASLLVSRLESLRRAERKIWQLQVAQHLGLRVPRSLLTSDPQAVLHFYEACQGRVICKPIAKGVLSTIPEQGFYTSRVLPEHLREIERVRLGAHFFQEEIPKALDLRVVVIGRQVFAVEIYSQQSTRTQLDWRRSYPDLTYGVHHLPEAIEAQLLQVVRTCALQFASMDLILTPTGEYIWIELNPNGQFYWMAEPTDLPLAEAMADLLAFPQEYAL